MGPAPSAAASVRSYTEKHLERLMDLVPAAALGEVEAVHDARAALRRVLSVYRGFGTTLMPVKRPVVKEAKSVVAHLGAVRDPQVALERLSEPPLPQDVPSLGALRRALVDEADEGLARLRPKQLRRRAEDVAASLRMGGDGPSDAEMGQGLVRQWELCERLRAEAEAYPPGAARWTHLHAQRKALKRLRYMAECLAAWAGEGVAAVARGAEERQGVLGSVNDCWQLELWLIAALRLPGVEEADVVRLLGVEDGALSAYDGDYRALAAGPLPRVVLPGG